MGNLFYIDSYGRVEKKPNEKNSVFEVIEKFMLISLWVLRIFEKNTQNDFQQGD